MEIALASVHPFQRPMQVESNMQRAAQRQPVGVDSLNHSRMIMLAKIQELAELLKVEETRAKNYVHSSLQPVAGKRALCLARELNYMCLLEDSSFVVDYTLGKPMLAWTRRALGQR